LTEVFRPPALGGDQPRFSKRTLAVKSNNDFAMDPFEAAFVKDVPQILSWRRVLPVAANALMEASLAAREQSSCCPMKRPRAAIIALAQLCFDQNQIPDSWDHATSDLPLCAHDTGPESEVLVIDGAKILAHVSDFYKKGGCLDSLYKKKLQRDAGEIHFTLMLFLRNLAYAQVECLPAIQPDRESCSYGKYNEARSRAAVEHILPGYLASLHRCAPR